MTASVTDVEPLTQAQKTLLADFRQKGVELAQQALGKQLTGCDYAAALGRGEARLYVEIELATFSVQFTGEWPGYFERTKLHEIVIPKPRLSS